MAALHYATAAAAAAAAATHRRHRFTVETLNPRKPISVISSFSTSFPTKTTRRKNHLRKKILKTLEKPFIPKPPPSNPVIQIEPPTFKEFEESIEEFEKSSLAGNQEVENFEELRELEASVQPPDGSVVGMLDKNSILKYGLWLFGAFVFQTVCAVWIFGSAADDNDDDYKNGILNGSERSSVLDVGGDGGVVKSIVLDSAVGSIFYVDELEMEREIEEIRVLARGAREKERLESKKKGFDGEENNGGKYNKSGIEEEVENRLIKLRKKLKNARDRVPVASIARLGKGSKRNDDGVGKLDEGESNGALTFKKKYKFKGLFGGDIVEKPKGFIGSKEDTRVKSGNRDLDTEEGEEDHVVEEDEKKYASENNTRKKVAEERGTSKQGKGIAMEKSNEGYDLEAVMPMKLNNVEAVKSRKSSAVVSKKLSKENISVKEKAAKSTVTSETGTDFWWLNLPYVSVILMQRGEGRKGLYTLKSIPSAEDQTSHMVAFEEHSDATNFCYLLQSFFEGLPDFEADVVPLTIKELNEAASSRAMRVIVVRRGLLRLYAGQPLADAELALRAMIK